MTETKTRTRLPRQILQTFQRLLGQLAVLHEKQARILQELQARQEEWQAALGAGAPASQRSRSRASEPVSNDH